MKSFTFFSRCILETQCTFDTYKDLNLDWPHFRRPGATIFLWLVHRRAGLPLTQGTMLQACFIQDRLSGWKTKF